MKKPFVLTSLLVLFGVAWAHEFWLAPQRFFFSRGEEINIRFRVGEHFEGENWLGNKDRIQQLNLHYADVTDDLSTLLSAEAGDSLQFSLFEEGTALVCFQSINSFIELEPQKFLSYLEEDGLQNAIAYRKEHNETDSAGREFYQRSVKTLVQVGTKKTNLFNKRTALPLDIIPLAHPYLLNNNDSIGVQVFFNNEPLANAKIRVWQKLAGAVTELSLQSNANGMIRFPMQTAGEWMVSCVHMIRLENDPKAQWQSYWGSITWGYTGTARNASNSR